MRLVAVLCSAQRLYEVWMCDPCRRAGYSSQVLRYIRLPLQLQMIVGAVLTHCLLLSGSPKMASIVAALLADASRTQLE
jgi:hypothetical protein